MKRGDFMGYKVTLRAARVNRGLTLKEVSKKTGWCIDTIASYEKNSSDIPHSLLVSLLDLYNVPFDLIFFGKQSDFFGQKVIVYG